MTVPTTFTISAHSLGIYDRCRRAYLHYKIDGRKAVRSAAGLIAGTAIHEGLDQLHQGADVAAQEAAINAVLAATPTPLDDYRTAGYLRDALAAFRVELAEVFKGWTVEEREAQGTVELGTVTVRVPSANVPVHAMYQPEQTVMVLWEYRRDLVAVSPEGLRLVCDYKTSSRNEDAHYLGMKMSSQLMGYVRSWQIQHPDKPVHGALPIRLILRRPSKNGVAFELPRDNPILFQPERLLEWQRHTLRKVRDLLSLDPSDPEDWPLAAQDLGCCRNQFGVCDYLPVCTLKPEDRMRYLMSDAYEDAAHHKPTTNENDTVDARQSSVG